MPEGASARGAHGEFLTNVVLGTVADEERGSRHQRWSCQVAAAVQDFDQKVETREGGGEPAAAK